VRGEVFFMIADFANLNASLVAEGKAPFAQPAQQCGRIATAEESGRDGAAPACG